MNRKAFFICLKKKNQIILFFLIYFFGGPDRSRTYNLEVRSFAPYPIWPRVLNILYRIFQQDSIQIFSKVLSVQIKLFSKTIKISYLHQGLYFLKKSLKINLIRVSIEFQKIPFFYGKPESVWHNINRRDFILVTSSVAKRSIQLSYRRKTVITITHTFFNVIL